MVPLESGRPADRLLRAKCARIDTGHLRLSAGERIGCPCCPASALCRGRRRAHRRRDATQCRVTDGHAGAGNSRRVRASKRRKQTAMSSSSVTIAMSWSFGDSTSCSTSALAAVTVPTARATGDRDRKTPAISRSSARELPLSREKFTSLDAIGLLLNRPAPGAPQPLSGRDVHHPDVALGDRPELDHREPSVVEGEREFAQRR